MPAFLSGIKPVTEEPWSRDARIYAHKFGRSFEWVPNQQMDGTAIEAYNDESPLDSNNGYEVKVTATGLQKKGQPARKSSFFLSTVPRRAFPTVPRPRRTDEVRHKPEACLPCSSIRVLASRWLLR